jgi:hypothetical protein
MEEPSDGLREKQKHGRRYGAWDLMDGSWLYRRRWEDNIRMDLQEIGINTRN